MEKPELIINYLLAINNGLSTQRLNLTLFLVDWIYAVNYAQTLFSNNWFYSDYGPTNPEIKKINSKTIIAEIDPPLGGTMTTRLQKSATEYNELSITEKATLDSISEYVKPLDIDSLRKLVSSTFPLLSSELNTRIDLIELAERSKALEHA